MAFYHTERLRLYVQHDAHEAARRAGQSAAADMLSVIARHHCTTRSTQPGIPSGSLNRVPASAGVRAGMSPLPGGR